MGQADSELSATAASAAASTAALRSRVQVLGLVCGPIVAALAFALLPAQYQDTAGKMIAFSQAGRITMALMAWMAIWWLTEAIDISATALLPIAVLPLAGAASIAKATAPYGSEYIFLFLGGFIMALSMQRWGLDRRIALITLRVVGAGPHMMVAGFMIATAMISAFVSNTATAAMMMPVGLSVVELVKRHQGIKGSRHQAVGGGAGLDRSMPGGLDASMPSPSGSDRNFAICVMLGIAYAASIGGVATIIGTPPNVFLMSFIAKTIDPAYRQEIGFLRWMMIGVPLAAVFLPLAWLLLTRVLFPIRMKQIEGGRGFIQQAYRELGPMKAGEWATFIVFMTAAILWIARPWLAQISLGEGGAKPLAGLSDSGIAILAALALFLIPVDRRGHRFAMNWETASKLPWGILILFGGGLSLAAAIEANGVAEFIGNQTARFGAAPTIVLVIIITAIVIFFSELASNTATATTVVPILAAMAPGLHVHPYLLIIPAGLAASYAFMMPVGTPPNAIVFGTGYVTMRQMMRAGIWLNLMAIVLITLLTYAIVKPLLGV